MFNQPVDNKYCYKLDLTIHINESKNVFGYLLAVGHGLPNVGEKKEFYFTRCPEINTKDVPLKNIALVFEDIEALVLKQFSANIFRVAEVNINIFYEKSLPLLIKKLDITTQEAKQIFDNTKHQVISEVKKYIPTYECRIM